MHGEKAQYRLTIILLFYPTPESHVAELETIRAILRIKDPVVKPAIPFKEYCFVLKTKKSQENIGDADPCSKRTRHMVREGKKKGLREEVGSSEAPVSKGESLN